jgi:hypothetical protein
VPVSKKRKKKRANKPSGPPQSKTAIATKKRKITKRQILIYVFSALIILSFALSFIVGSGGGSSGPAVEGGGHSGVPNVSGDGGDVLFTPVPGEDSQVEDDAELEDDAEPQNNTSSESDTEN